MKKFILVFATVLSLFTWATVAAHVPPGNDGGQCHGANQIECRPDPQPSHGKDCQPHGNNPDGNDDHCGPIPSSEPSTEPSEPPLPDTGGGPDVPQLTPPPTDTE